MIESRSSAPSADQCLVVALDDLAGVLAMRRQRLDLKRPEEDPVRDFEKSEALTQHVRARIVDAGSDGVRVELDGLIQVLDELALRRFDAGDFPTALVIDRHLLSIRQDALSDEDPLLIASAALRVARGHFQLGEYGHAIQFAEQSLSGMVNRLGSAHPDLLPMLNSLSGAYIELSRYEEARNTAGRAMAIAEENYGSVDPRIVPALDALAIVSRASGKFGEAHAIAERAVEIQCRAFGEESFEAGNALSRLAIVLGQIGESDRSRQLFQRALNILRAARDRPVHKVNSEIATTLANLAGASSDIGELESARPLYREAIALRRAVSGDDHPETARLLSNVALFSFKLGERAEALAMWTESLKLRRRVLGNLHPDVARGLIDVAFARFNMGETAGAVRVLAEALAILALYDLPAITARAYSSLASIAERYSLAAAIFFAKLVVNTTQMLRSDAAMLGSDFDRAFLGTRERAYRLLGDALIVSGRLPEAQQILAMLKEVELLEIIPAGLDPRISAASLTALEARWSERGERIRVQIKLRLKALQRDSCGNAGAGPEFDQAFAESVAALEKWLAALVQAFSGSEDVPTGHEFATAPAVGGEPVASRQISPGTAFLQYLLANDHLRIVLTVSGMQRHYDVTFAEGEVNRLVYELRSALQEGSRHLDSARRLHEILIGPLRSDLDAAGARTLAFSLDGVLRYLPIAALSDGERYLLEDFALILAARAPVADGAGPDPSDLRAAGFGVTRAIGPHRALHAVREELNGVIRTDANARGILPGLIALNEAFTTGALRDAIASRHAVIHIASHFTLNAAQEPSSYLLLGDGSKLTLVDLSELRFEGVELVVLSACDTAMGGGHRQSGCEIEGLGALVHRRGARNVIATLWPVRDFTTATMMRRFYENWYQQRLAAPEALRQAQLSLYRGNDTNPAGPARAILDPGDKKESAWNHPRFWAPYLLMGQPWLND